MGSGKKGTSKMNGSDVKALKHDFSLPTGQNWNIIRAGVSSQGGTRFPWKVDGCRFVLGSSLLKGVDYEMKLKISFGKKFEFSLNIDKATLFAILMLFS
jgi:hypothetical protein